MTRVDRGKDLRISGGRKIRIQRCTHTHTRARIAYTIERVRVLLPISRVHAKRVRCRADACRSFNRSRHCARVSIAERAIVWRFCGDNERDFHRLANCSFPSHLLRAGIHRLADFPSSLLIAECETAFRRFRLRFRYLWLDIVLLIRTERRCFQQACDIFTLFFFFFLHVYRSDVYLVVTAKAIRSRSRDIRLSAGILF